MNLWTGRALLECFYANDADRKEAFSWQGTTEGGEQESQGSPGKGRVAVESTSDLANGDGDEYVNMGKIGGLNNGD
ncbi:hypothetical protein Acr_14g0004210 [Actinidia rufa]|uniref:Uncharacterized protein n=1 Tax=Actinidia rufa TaxID=165716 RepID=A0A7J0FPZ8_9ERIC|nr:hypothetical protein Acr_14g0004210 [Actinidia rufa]